MNENKQIHVWDLFVRVFHWSLVLLFLVAYPTGDDKGSLHRNAGYVVLGLVVIRIVWGFWGTKHALFRDFICSPAKAFIYLKELVAGKPTYYTGHNPAAAWMIILLLVSSIIICLSGYAAYTTKGNKPSLGFSNKFSIVENAYADGDEKEEYEDEHEERERPNKAEKEEDEADSLWSDIHEMSAQFMLILIFLHIAGVAVSSIMHRENLLQSMITGGKDMHFS